MDYKPILFIIAGILILFSLIHQAIIISRLKRKEEALNLGELQRFSELVEKNYDVTELLHVNICHLNKYYKQAYEQSDKSFKLAQNASVGGYSLLVGGIIFYVLISQFSDVESVHNMVLIISTISGVISKIISSIYFYLYNKSNEKLDEYHDKLYKVQNIAISLNLVERIESVEKQDDVRVEMIRQLLEQKICHDK